MNELLTFADELGPLKIVHIYNPKVNLRAVLAIDNVAAGPSIGGIRMAPDVTAKEAFRLARAMTLKNAAAGLAHGGGKAVIQANPKTISHERKEELIRSFALAIRDLTEYIPGPDMGTNEECMAWIQDEIGRSVGLPKTIGGIPLDEIGATGIGIAQVAITACQLFNIDLNGAKVCIQGFGAVGKHSAIFLEKLGAKIVGVADSKGTVVDSNGLDVNQLLSLKQNGKSVVDYDGAHSGTTESIISTPCDIWIPAARPDVITKSNVQDLQTKLIIQGANIPITPEAEEILFAKGVQVIPDFIANAGGVICAAVEFHGGTEKVAVDTINQKIKRNTEEVLNISSTKNISPRKAANQLALSRLKEAMTFKRFG